MGVKTTTLFAAVPELPVFIGVQTLSFPVFLLTSPYLAHMLPGQLSRHALHLQRPKPLLSTASSRKPARLEGSTATKVWLCYTPSHATTN